MKLVDLSAAILVGLLSVTTVVAWSPVQYQSAARGFTQQAALRDTLISVINNLGLVWLQDSLPRDVCARLSSYSNSTLTVTATIGTFSCGHGPPRGAVHSSISLSLPTGRVTLEDWRDAGR